ncbi:MAG: hypothetical protein A2V45_02215 [Candidatus Aminicenantes bacterium RBG_19FT_COMBO_58_17]|jgi:transcriptional regulator with XRE-family HTH domain|nr:MAG: hypothetical protein A2V45_02215 [Candidatus Aminicenantes bacterium RBG_19FT_COMBO_58_17]
MEDIGRKIRWLRKARGITIEEFARKLGMTQPHLSLIETGKRGISIPLLRRILDALDTNLAMFFSSYFHENKVVYKKNDNVFLPSPKTMKIGLLVPAQPGQHLDFEELIFEPRGTLGECSSHRGEEFGYVLEGRGKLKVDGKEYELIKGDSFYFHSYLPHTMHNTSGTQKLRILCVCTPSAF